MPLILHFPDDGWEKIREEWSAWWAGELDRALVVLECVEPPYESTPHYASTFLGNYGVVSPAVALLDLFAPRLEATHWLGDAFPRFWPNFGPGVVAAFAGARLYAVQDTTWFSPGVDLEISKLHVKLHANNSWWKRVRTVTQAAVERWGEQLSIGVTDLGGNLDILAHLRGTQQLLMDLMDSPEQVERLVNETHQLWMHCYQTLYNLTCQGQGITCWGPCWSVGRGYMLQADFAYMISPKMFERFVLPEIDACCKAMDYGFYHLDGKGQIPHLDMLLSLSHLRGIQWVPGDGQPQAEDWPDLIQHIRRSGKLCQVFVGAQGALRILGELGGKGLLLAINETLTPEQGRALLEEIRLLDRSN
jgi:5-methyltetrahydrofolate--homocysteine methyltransferase